MFTILTCDPLFYIFPPTSQALRLDAGCHQMLLPAMQLVRNLNTFCCVVDRNHPQSHVGAFTAGKSFPQIQFPGTVAEICCSFRGFYIFPFRREFCYIFVTLSPSTPLCSPQGSWIDKNELHKYYGVAQVSKSLRITSCLATSLLLDKAQEFICRHPAHDSPAARGNLVAVLFRIHGSVTYPRPSAYLRSAHLIIHSLS